MLNKKGSASFGEDDEVALATCVNRLADELSDKFKDLLRVSDKLAGKFMHFVVKQLVLTLSFFV